MKRALIIGIDDGFGLHTAVALLANGWHVRVLMRAPAKLPAWMKGMEVIAGDISSIDDVRRAANGTDAIVFGVDLSDTRGDEPPAWLEASRSAAEILGTTLVVSTNVYADDPDDVRRPSIADRLETAAQRGAQTILLRTGDLIGAHSKNNWINTLIRPTAKHGLRLLQPVPPEHVHFWANLPDVARTVSHLLMRRHELPPHATFDFAGYRVNFAELADALHRASGKPIRLWPSLRQQPRSLVSYVRQAWEPKKMHHLRLRELSSDDAPLREALGGSIPQTPLPDALLAAGLVASAAERSLHWSYVGATPPNPIGLLAVHPRHGQPFEGRLAS